MKEFEVKFEVFDKKLKVKVKAIDEMEALEYVKNTIKIHSIVPVDAEHQKKNIPPPPKNGTTDEWFKYLESFLGGFRK